MTRSNALKTSTPQRSAHDALAHVTAEITRLLEQGVMPWRAPWDRNRALAATPGLPLRCNGEPYRGANVPLLWAAQIARGHAKRTWLTYRQALELGGQVRKGEKACPVVYYGQATTKHGSDDNAETARNDETRRYRFLKLFHVFNVEQIDNLPADFGAEIAHKTPPPSVLDAWIARSGAKVRVGGAMAYYSPATDTIHMPPLEAFVSAEQETATKLHELVHFTGHSSRLDRLQDYAADRRARSREELTAEIGSAMLGAMIGLPPDHLEDHAAYCASWLNVIQDEPRAFFSAGAKAQAAVDWLIAKAGLPAAPPRSG